MTAPTDLELGTDSSGGQRPRRTGRLAVRRARFPWAEVEAAARRFLVRIRAKAVLDATDEFVVLDADGIELHREAFMPAGGPGSEKATEAAERLEAAGTATPPAKPGRPPAPDLEYALLARRYVELVDSAEDEQRRSPIKGLAKEFHLSESTARNKIHAARHERGLLSKPPVPNRPGGDLTPKAFALLAEHDERNTS